MTGEVAVVSGPHVLDLQHGQIGRDKLDTVVDLVVAVGEYLVVELPRDVLVLQWVASYLTRELHLFADGGDVLGLFGAGSRRELDVELEGEPGGVEGVGYQAGELGVVGAVGGEGEQRGVGEVVGFLVGCVAGVGGRRVGASGQVQREGFVLVGGDECGRGLEEFGREADVEEEGGVHGARDVGDGDAALEFVEVVGAVGREGEVAGG